LKLETPGYMGGVFRVYVCIFVNTWQMNTNMLSRRIPLFYAQFLFFSSSSLPKFTKCNKTSCVNCAGVVYYYAPMKPNPPCTAKVNQQPTPIMNGAPSTWCRLESQLWMNLNWD
jgi:hypothetical protein